MPYESQSKRLIKSSLGLILLLGVLLPLTPLVHNPLHPDEALYAYWGRLIAAGQDPMLNTVPVDKPPLFIYLLAFLFNSLGVSEVTARLPGLLAHLATIGLTFDLGRVLYDRNVGLVAALLVSLSPYAILFAPTALTDPLLVAFVMVAARAAAGRRAGLAALGLGLAVATKQQGLFFLPLILGLLVLAAPGQQRQLVLVRFGIIFIVTLLIPLIWDLSRTRRPGFWLQSSLNYGGVSLAARQFEDRLLSFLQLLYLMSASRAMTYLFLAGLPWLLFVGRRSSHEQQANVPAYHCDRLLILFSASFLLLHALLNFQVWDRYLLGLLPLLALLTARILLLPASQLKLPPSGATILTMLLILILMAGPARTAIRSGFSLGGDSGAFAGVAEVAAYMRGQVGANVTLYHHALGTHWRYYLFGFPYDLRYWRSAADLADQAAENAAGEQYIAFPSWQSPTEVSLALADHNLQLQPRLETFRPDGTPAVVLYKIVAASSPGEGGHP